jgi:Flp pilus assembly pilin Flp
MCVLGRLLRDGSGATAIGCGHLIACIAVAIMAAIKSIGGGLRNTFADVSDNVANAGQ